MRRLWIGKRGFTLIEMLVTVVILGILASISVKVVSAKRNAYIAAMKSDLRNLATAQEAYFYDHFRYASTWGNGMGMGCAASGGKAVPTCPGVDWRPSPGVKPQLFGDETGFSGVMTHDQIPDRCAIFRGLPVIVYPPAVEDGMLVCDGAAGGGGGGGMGMGMGMGGM